MGFVHMSHPDIDAPPAQVPDTAVPHYTAGGWVLVDPPPPPRRPVPQAPAAPPAPKRGTATTEED